MRIIAKKVSKLLLIVIGVLLITACTPTVKDKYFLKGADEDIHEDTQDLMGNRPFSIF